MSGASKVRAMSKFADALNEQIAYEFGASQQYIAIAVHYDAQTLPQLAAHFYRQAVEERNHAMMMVQYLLDADDEDGAGAAPVGARRRRVDHVQHDPGLGLVVAAELVAQLDVGHGPALLVPGPNQQREDVGALLEVSLTPALLDLRIQQLVGLPEAALQAAPGTEPPEIPPQGLRQEEGRGPCVHDRQQRAAKPFHPAGLGDAEDGGDRVQREQDVGAADRDQHEEQRREQSSAVQSCDELAAVVVVGERQAPAGEGYERVVVDRGVLVAVAEQLDGGAHE